MNRFFFALAVSLIVSVPVAGQVGFNRFAMPDDPDRAWLGVMIRDLSLKDSELKKFNRETGALITEIVEDSPADDAGLLADDVIIRFGERTIDDSEELRRAVRRSDPGDKVEITVDRKGERKTVTVKLERMKSSGTYSFTIPNVPEVVPGPFHMEFFGHARFYGLEVQDLGKQLAEYFEIPGKRGVLVTSVQRKSVAEKAGVKAGDVIVRVNGNTVTDTDDLADELSESEKGEIPLEIIRRGKPVTVNLPAHSGDDDSDLSLYFRHGNVWSPGHRLEIRDRFRFRRELLDGIKEKLLELKEDLRDGASLVRDAIRRELRNL